MDFEQTDQEQVEKLRNWWQENWLPLVGGLVLGLGGILGWEQYRDWRLSQAANASGAYESVANKLAAGDVDAASAQAVELVAQAPKSPYAAHAKLALAKAAADAGNWEAAAEHLNWVMESGHPRELRPVARLRLAKARWAQGQLDQALALLDVPATDPFGPACAELRGDIARQKGDLKRARAAYEQALAADADYIDRALLQRKLDDLATKS